MENKYPYIVEFRGAACKTVRVIFSNGAEIGLPRHQAILLGCPKTLDEIKEHKEQRDTVSNPG